MSFSSASTERAPLELRFRPGYASLGEPFSVETPQAPLRGVRLLDVHPDAAEAVGLDLESAAAQQALARWLNGEARPEGAPPARAAVYAGHQFGHYVPRLGDGRAHVLGQIEARRQSWELQVKGGGPTPFSRGGDGRAVLRSTIREYLCSEAMAALGIPTTRAVALAGSDSPVRREVIETGALLLRAAPSHLRFGSFEYFFRQGDFSAVARLAEFALAELYPGLAEPDDPQRFRLLYREVIRRTADLAAAWQAVGFCHGVLNTDNMSLLGLTLDYGPFGFLDATDPRHVCNHSDHTGRYAYHRQPEIVQWNLARLGDALRPVLPQEEAQEELEAFAELLVAGYTERMRQKLGLASWNGESDGELLGALIELLTEQEVDYTRFFRALAEVPATPDPAGPLRALFQDPEPACGWALRYRRRLAQDGDVDPERHRAQLEAVNPRYVLRNHLAQQAIEAAEGGELEPLLALRETLRRPFTEQPRAETLGHAEPPPAGARCVVSCSS